MIHLEVSMQQALHVLHATVSQGSCFRLFDSHCHSLLYGSMGLTMTYSRDDIASVA